MKGFWFLLILLVSCNVNNENKYYDFETHFEKSKGLETATYLQTIEFYTKLSEVYSEISIDSIGNTDSGKPLHIVTLNKDAVFNFSEIKNSNKRILLINNGIHPGESDGIDATMMLFRDLVNGKIEIPKNTVLVTIPIYNIGGSLNRNSTTRTNQNGPVSYGFRGNARNYDLNRDFIKCDTKNAKTFAKIFHLVKPDVFIDNHVSNGADYQYTLTHLFTQHNKLGHKVGNYLHSELMPQLEQNLIKKNWDITPYVNVFNAFPEKGFPQFIDSPRYSTGYTTLFNTLGMMVETHMLKPYKKRVEGTYELMKSMVEIIEKDGSEILELRAQAYKNYKSGNLYPINWVIDSSKHSTLNFKGFEGKLVESDVTGFNRLKYDRTKPFTKEVSYRNYYKPSLEISIPSAYVIPQGWHQVIDLLKLNQVQITKIERDTLISVEAYKIKDYETRPQAYEGHYPHYNVSISTVTKVTPFRRGDYIITTEQPSVRYLLETLEPQAVDSFFNWNFFDTILQQKEGFSPYVWEDRALELLNQNPELKAEFEHRKKDLTEFRNNWFAQLDWLHKQSEHYESAHLQYPVYRIK